MTKHRDTLYPYELLDLLEALDAEGFTGMAVLVAPAGQTTLFFRGGRVRYAMSTEMALTFPAFLITWEVFPRERIHRWLETCTDEEMTIEELVLGRRQIDPDGLVALKGDLGAAVLARAFGLTCEVTVEPAMKTSPHFGDLVLDPYLALFRGVAEQPIPGAMMDRLQGLWERPIRRGPGFFTLLADFHRAFPGSPLPLAIDGAPTLSELTARTEEPEALIAQVFVMNQAGMTHFQGEKARAPVLRRGRAAPRRAPALVIAGQSRPITRPGIGASSAAVIEQFAGGGADELGPKTGAPGGVILEPALIEAADASTTVAPARDTSDRRPHAPTRARMVIPPPPPEEPDHGAAAVPFALSDFADLHGGLVARSLLAEAADTERASHYVFFGIEPDAPLSTIRAAYFQARRRYRDESFGGHHLCSKAGSALRRLQRRVEEAYEALIDPRARAEHDARHGVSGRLSTQSARSVYYAEGVFKAAQIRLARGQAAEAIGLLDEAMTKNPHEPEYVAYLAWAVYAADLAGQDLPHGIGHPAELLSRALELGPRLESAWLFRARMAEQAGDAPTALAAFREVLSINPDNEEAAGAVSAYEEQGVRAGRLSRPSLSARLARMLRWRPAE